MKQIWLLMIFTAAIQNFGLGVFVPNSQTVEPDSDRGTTKAVVELPSLKQGDNVGNDLPASADDSKGLTPLNLVSKEQDMNPVSKNDGQPIRQPREDWKVILGIALILVGAFSIYSGLASKPASKGPTVVTTSQSIGFDKLASRLVAVLVDLIGTNGHVSENDIAEVNDLIQVRNNDWPSKQPLEQLNLVALRPQLERCEMVSRTLVQHLEGDKEILRRSMKRLISDLVEREGSVSQDERNLLRKVSAVLLISPHEFEALENGMIPKQSSTPTSLEIEPVGNLANYYAALGCSESDSDRDIQLRHRKLVMELHPDTIASKGLSDAFIKFSERRFSEVNEAYREIMRARRQA